MSSSGFPESFPYSGAAEVDQFRAAGGRHLGSASNRSRYQRRRATTPPANNSVRRTYDLLRSSLPALEPDALLIEDDLISSLSASRNTVRIVLQLLAAQGLVKRGPKVGTTVGSSMVLPISELISFGDVIESSIRSRLLESFVIPAPALVRERLELEQGASVAVVEGLLADDIGPIALAVSYVALPADFSDKVGNDSADIVMILEDEMQVCVGDSDTKLAAVACDAQTATQLEIDEGAPMLWLEDLLRDSNGTPRALSQMRYRADRVMFSTTANRREADSDEGHEPAL